jgi:hypothetical protein
VTHECTEERFLKDVSEHQMTVLRDDGVERHIRFRKPGTRCMGFDLITWPGHLCYTGDMGTYVFQRLEDMFQFFRTDREYNRSRGRNLAINPGYWGEKLEAVARNGGYREWSHDLFEQAVREDLKNFLEGSELDEDCRTELQEAVESDVLHCSDEYEAVEAVRNFSHDHAGRLFDDFWEHRLEDYTFHFVWCCYALAWGVERYDEAKASGADVESRAKEDAKP